VNFARTAATAGALLIVVTAATAQVNPTGPPMPPPAPPPTVQKLSDTTFRIGQLQVNTATREVTMPGRLNDVMVLEFIANARGGAKAYESAITLDADAITFNTAMLLIGLDPARSKPSQRQFDPEPPVGDPVDLFVSWNDRDRVRIEELIFDRRSSRALPPRTWVYTGSSFIVDSDGRRRFTAELDGVLIGFMHSPSSIIENPLNDALGVYGQLVLNPNLGLPANAPVTLTVKALPRAAAAGRTTARNSAAR
jgi:hypothetical protein